MFLLFRLYVVVYGSIFCLIKVTCLRNVKISFKAVNRSVRLYSQLIQKTSYYRSLENKNWIKLICGASNQDVTFIRNLCFLYTLHGVDCIDISADIAVIKAAHQGIDSALLYNNKNNIYSGTIHRPLLMISVNDDDDPHFRKAYFDKTKCPSDCSRPCERVCPADAIPSLTDTRYITQQDKEGVIMSNCYGCGRCLSVCPLGLIDAQYYTINPSHINDMFRNKLVDGIEIHTLAGHKDKFETLFRNIESEVLNNAKVLAVSFPKINQNISDTIAYINDLYHIMSSSNNYQSFKTKGIHIWQTDGKPMTGDTGKGSARAAVAFASNLLDTIEESKQINHRNNNNNNNNNDTHISYLLCNNSNSNINNIENTYSPHFIQLAGGTNNYSFNYSLELGLYNKTNFGGYAYGGYARKYINSILENLDKIKYSNDNTVTTPNQETIDSIPMTSDKPIQSTTTRSTLLIEDFPYEFQLCMKFIEQFIGPVKTYNNNIFHS